MRIVCPHCDAAYDVPESRLGTVRRLRCARCAQEWQLAPEPAPLAELVSPDLPPPASAAPPGPFPTDSSAPVLSAPVVSSPVLSAGSPLRPLSRSPRPRPQPSSAIVDALDGVPAPASVGAPADAPSPGLSVEAPLVERGGRPRRGAPVLAGWAVTVLVLAALLAAGYVWRGPIKVAWPPSQRAYAAIGLN